MTATQRMRQGRYLYQEGSRFALAIHVGGEAVECLLCEFKGSGSDPTFDEKHHLLRLFAASGMLRLTAATGRRIGPMPESICTCKHCESL